MDTSAEQEVTVALIKRVVTMNPDRAGPEEMVFSDQETRTEMRVARNPSRTPS